jgi:microcystin-dependent protein
MSDTFLAEIRIFAGNFAPVGWALCNGQLMAISQNTALFSLLGTTFGGDGKTTFGLPDLRGAVPIQAGQGPGLSLYQLGQAGGAGAVALTSSQVASHNHTFNCGSGGRGNTNAVQGNVNTDAPFQKNIYATATDGTVMSPTMIAPTAPSQPHNNMQPYVALTFIIALQGIYPPRS